MAQMLQGMQNIPGFSQMMGSGGMGQPAFAPDGAVGDDDDDDEDDDVPDLVENFEAAA